MLVHADGSVKMTEEEQQGMIIPAYREPEVVAGLYQQTTNEIKMRSVPRGGLFYCR